MVAANGEFARRNIIVAAISFAEPEKLRRYQDHHQWPIVVLADPELQVYRALGLSRLSWRQLLTWHAMKAYFRLLWAGGKIQSPDGADVHQGGGDFLVDAEGRIRFAYRSQDPADRPTVEQILNAIDGSRATA